MFSVTHWSDEAFCDKLEIFSTVFVDIKVAYDTAHIPSLVNRLTALNVPQKMCGSLQLLFWRRDLHFYLLPVSKNFVLFFRNLLQGNCLSSIIFNVYSFDTIRSLNVGGEFLIFFYANEIVVFAKLENLN